MSEKGKIKRYFPDRGFGFINHKGRDGRNVARNITPSQEIISLKLPKDTRSLIGSNVNVVENFFLKLQKCIEFEKGRDGKEKAKIRPDYDFKFDEELINQINCRIHSWIEILKQDSLIRELKASVDWRLVVGLGSESVYETSMTLHHIYGIPYIPGSAVKGVVRSWIITKKFKENEKEALRSPEFVKIFGNQNQHGKIIFMDAFPNHPPKIVPDIMTPHYGDYYSSEGRKVPADYLSPNPVPFLTVKDTSFDFCLLSKKRDSEIFNLRIGERTIIDWLKDALSNHGIGAKTAVGYGIFNVEE